MAETNDMEKWLVYLPSSLRNPLKDEAKRNDRSAVAQLRMILAERYKVEYVEPKDEANGLAQQMQDVIVSGKGRKATPRSRKSTKQGNG